VPISCAAIPETLLESELFGHEKGAFSGALTVRQGRFELAHGGTLFLDGIGDLPLPCQAKLVRALEERAFERVGGSRTIRVNVRIVAATNQELDQLVRERRFRADLYYRLQVIPMTIPPLRERASDIPLLVQHFLAHCNEVTQSRVEGFTEDALAALCRYAWPGNVRELENLIERLVVLKRHGWITADELPDHLREEARRASESWGTDHATLLEQLARGQCVSLKQELEQYELRCMLAALQKTHGVVSQAARLLRLKRTTFAQRLKRMGVRMDRQRQAEPASQAAGGREAGSANADGRVAGARR